MEFTLEEEAIVSKLVKKAFIALAAKGAQKRSGSGEGGKCLFFLDTFILDGCFYFFLPCQLFFFVACFLTPVVFAAYETDVIEHSWSSEETLREEERTSRCFAARPLSSIPLHKANPPITHTQTAIYP